MSGRRERVLPARPVTGIDEYLATDTGGLGLARAQELGPAGTIEELTRAGLRGRGGAGFPTGRKWASIAGQGSPTTYAVCNAAEGEPATFKDRALLRANPYQVVEGLLIAALAVDAQEAFLALKASFAREVDAVTRAVAELQQAGICPDCQVTIVQGPDDYLFGEEKALLEVIEGKDALPRLLPPYEHGLFASAPQAGWSATDTARGREAADPHPTLVNNVETLANVPHVLAHGADRFRALGTAESPGTQVCTVVGDVARPGVGEMEMGTPLRVVLDEVGGGVGPGRTVKAVLPGVSAAVVTAEQLDVPLSYEGFATVGSGLGAAGFVVYDDRTCMVEVALLASRFLAAESCGQCPPCKQGTAEITGQLATLAAGDGDAGTLDRIGGWLDRVTDANRCFLGTQELLVVGSILAAFPDDVRAHLDRGCPGHRDLRLPRLADLDGGRIVLAPARP